MTTINISFYLFSSKPSVFFNAFNVFPLKEDSWFWFQLVWQPKLVTHELVDSSTD